MRVTVIISNRNYQKEVVRAIQSVYSQTYEHTQLIVVDDGSTDESWEEILRLTEDSEIPTEVFRLEESIGPARVRNLAIRTVWDQSEYFAFLDSDDEYLPGKISRSVKQFQSDPQRIGLVYTDEFYNDEVNGRKFERFRRSFNLDQLLKLNICGGSYIVSKEALSSSGIFDEAMPVAEMYDLALRICQKYVAVHLPETLVSVNLASQSLYHSCDSQIWSQCMEYSRRKALESSHSVG